MRNTVKPIKKPKQVDLATLRASKGMTQKDLAEYIGVSPGLIGLYETGKRTPGLARAKQISILFNTSLDSISFVTLS